MTTKTVKGYRGRIGMDGLIATWYARMTRKNIDYYRSEARKVADAIEEGAAVLEIAPGPGYLAIALAQFGRYAITGLDISTSFVDIAQANAREAGVAIDFRQGNAAQMPFEDGSFDFIVCTAAFKNFAAPLEALNEIHRVLKPGAEALIVDLRGDVSPETMDQHVQQELHQSGINAFITKWTFRNMLIKRAYTKGEFEGLAAQSHFKTCSIQEDLIGMNIRFKKQG